MNTAGTGALSSIGYLMMLAAAIASAALVLGQLGPRLRAPRPGALALFALVAVPSLIELGWHGIYSALSRQPSLIRAHHQYWRLLTSALVQDGGVAGTIFNLVVLFLIATLAVCVWGAGRTIGLFAVGAIGFNLMATYAFASSGGGNSGATFFLATSLVGLAVVRLRSARALAAAAVVVVVGIALIATNDAHGVPILCGLVIGVALAMVSPPREPARTGAGAARAQWRSSYGRASQTKYSKVSVRY
jgi:hypothetical protein